MKIPVKFKSDNLKKYFEKINKTQLIFVLGIIGIVLIFLSEFIFDGSKSNTKKNKKTTASYSADSDETEIFRKKTEEQLKQILENIDGVGECGVMVTVEGTTEYVYAENINEYNDSEGDRKSDKREHDIVMVEKDGEKQALVKKVIKPQISGVVVVCEGGKSVKVSERVLNAVSTALGISSNKICVESKS